MELQKVEKGRIVLEQSEKSNHLDRDKEKKKDVYYDDPYTANAGRAKLHCWICSPNILLM